MSATSTGPPYDSPANRGTARRPGKPPHAGDDVAFYTPGEPRIPAIARKQHGVATRRQLRERGVAEDRIDSRIRSGRLRPIHRRVFEVRGMATSYTPYMAAVLACGDGAVLCGGSAAALWSLPGAGEELEVLVEDRHRRVRGVRARRVRAFVAGETTTLHGIPITTPARTLLDLARVLSSRRLEQAIAQAERDRIMTRAELEALLALRPRHAGARRIRALLERVGQLAFTRSPPEERLLGLIDHTGLPRPRVNDRVAGMEVDLHWPDHRLIAEVDGVEHHGTHRAFHTDRQRDAVLVARGYRVMRITAKTLDEDPVTVMVRLTEALLTPLS